MERVAGIPLDTLRRHFERGLGAQAGLARVAPHVRRLIEYRQLNLLEIGDLGERFDVIFCRNVMIYFDRDVQQRVVSLLERHLAPGGYLFISHSESLNGISHGLRWVAPAIYQRSDRMNVSPSASTPATVMPIHPARPHHAASASSSASASSPCRRARTPRS